MKSNLLNGLVLAALVLPGAAMAADAAPAPEYTLTSNIAYTSDYVFNGISQNFRNPALQGGFDYAHASGWYAGVWSSNISGNQYTNASLENDLYAGYNGKVNDDLAYNLGLMEVFYPGGKAYNATPQTYKKWDTASVLAGATWNGLNIKYTYTLTNWYGIASNGFTPTMLANGATTADGANVDSKGSGYLEANYTYDFGDGLSVTGHAGHQKIRNFSKLSYSDYKLAVAKTVAGYTFGAAYTNTNATDNSLYHVIANGDDRKLSGSIFAVSLSRSF